MYKDDIPGCQFCGPGTNFEKLLSKSDTEIDPLDEYCKLHDIAYSRTNISERQFWKKLHVKD